MGNFPINTGIRKAGAITKNVILNADDEWFVNDTIVLLSNSNVVATLVVDFAFSVSSVVEYTLDGGATFIAFNNGDEVTGGQSRFIDVDQGVEVNFRAKTGGTLIRCIVSSVP